MKALCTARRFCHVAALLAAADVVSCFARGGGVLPQKKDDGDAGESTIHFVGDASDPNAVTALPDIDPHAVRGVDPNHGSFAGGQHAVIRGNGFTSAARVWFGANEVNPADITPIDPQRIQVVVPAGEPGSVDVTVQNGDDQSTARTAPEAYAYDTFYVSPTTGPLSGGTLITLFGQDTHWDESTQVAVDFGACDIVALRQPLGRPQELDCRTPPGTPGAKAVRVTTGDETLVLLDAFVYGNSDDGFRGGLSGDPLLDHLRVLVLSNVTGEAIPTAVVVLGSAQSGTSEHRADNDGHVSIQRDGLGPTQTVTVAATCFMPVTFIDVPVDTVTVYLDPVLSPDCADDNPPPSPGSVTTTSSTIEGEIVFPAGGGTEFGRAWSTVPVPADPNSERVAYIFPLDRDGRRSFRLPANATAITPESDGTVGYAFKITGALGNLTLYALAGIENRQWDPPLFTAYSMGLVSGVFGKPNETTSDVFIPMTIPLDHALSVTVDGPTPTARGPDRVKASVAVRYGNLGYVILPSAQNDALLPGPVTFDFVGLPPLAGALTDADYVVSATAATGLSYTPPLSVIGLFSPSAASSSISLDGFLEVPRLDIPGENGLWAGTELALSVEPGGSSADLTVAAVNSDSSATTWVIVAPGDPAHIALPDPAQIPEIGLRSGPISLDVARARITAFDYGALGYADLSTRNWDAYATDTVQAHYE